MIPLVILLAAAMPSASDVQAAEETRVLAPLIDYTRDGRAYVEFAPTVETRNVACAPVKKNLYECTYQSRLKDALASEFGPWETRREHILRRRNHWRLTTSRR